MNRRHSCRTAGAGALVASMEFSHFSRCMLEQSDTRADAKSSLERPFALFLRWRTPEQDAQSVPSLDHLRVEREGTPIFLDGFTMLPQFIVDPGQTQMDLPVTRRNPSRLPE